MRVRKLQAWICGALLGASLWLPGQVSAEIRTVEADGFYQMGDGMAENQAIAKERARVEAVRSAGEQAATYVESFTAVSNGKVTKDDIRLMTAAVLEIRDVKFTPMLVGDSVKFQCHVVAVVDTDKVKEKIQEDNMLLKSSLQKYQDENERLRKEMEELKKQYQTATPSQKQQIEVKVNKNDQEFEANSYFEKGRVAQNQEDYNKAIEYYKKAITLKPDYVSAYNNMGVAYGMLKDNDNSIGCLKKAIKYGNNDYEDYLQYYNLGALYVSLEQYQEGIEYLEKAISLNPNHKESNMILGVAYACINDYQRLINHSETMIRMNPNDINGYLLLGSAYDQQNNYQKAIECYEKVIRIEPDYAAAYNLIAKAYKNLGYNQKANEYYEKACALDPEFRNEPI